MSNIGLVIIMLWLLAIYLQLGDILNVLEKL